MRRYYLMPMMHNGLLGDAGEIMPKYRVVGDGLGDLGLQQGLGYTCMRLGAALLCVFEARDIDADKVLRMAALTDVTSIPEDLDSPVGLLNRDSVKSALESHGWPVQWITDRMTWRAVLRKIGATCQFCQSLNGIGAGSVFTGRSWDAIVSELSEPEKESVRQAADRISLDRRAVRDTATLRSMVEEFSEQYDQTRLVREDGGVRPPFESGSGSR